MCLYSLSINLFVFVTGLVIHCSHVHKKTVTEIPNAFPHRNNLEMDIYGTEGIPEKDRMERERNKGAGT